MPGQAPSDRGTPRPRLCAHRGIRCTGGFVARGSGGVPRDGRRVTDRGRGCFLISRPTSRSRASPASLGCGSRGGRGEKNRRECVLICARVLGLRFRTSGSLTSTPIPHQPPVDLTPRRKVFIFSTSRNIPPGGSRPRRSALTRMRSSSTALSDGGVIRLPS